MGVFAAFNTAYLDNRIKAGINMDGSLYEVENRDVINKPFMFIRSGVFKGWLEDFKSNTDSDNEVIKQLTDEVRTY